MSVNPATTGAQPSGCRRAVAVPVFGSDAMTWLAAWCVALSLLVFVGFLSVLLFFAGQWLVADAPNGSMMTALLDTIERLLLSGGGNGEFNAMLPAIVGTSVVVILMSVLVAPLGVVVAIYLCEYARGTWYTELVRIGMQNLAGVPSIIYGVFGLTFFVYTIGGSLDEWFYADRLPSPTLGSPGLLWAAITLALLTLPTVVVAAEEGLQRIPNSLREGSYALGATRIETIIRVLIPAASPSFITGIILAIARAAGEVAPLMLVGVVKFAPELPINLQAPFVHLEHKFMHMGFYIFDVANHAALGSGRLGLLCAASLFLVAVILSLNISAIVLRSSLRRRFDSREDI